MKKALGPHYEEHEYLVRVVPVEDAAGQLTVRATVPPRHRRGFRAAHWMLGKLSDVAEDALYEGGSGNGVV